MSNPPWPESLPGFLISGYQEPLPSVTIRTEMDAGVAKVRRRFTKGITQVSGQLSIMTSAQVDALETFFNNTLQGGALKFDWTHPRTDAAVTMRFLEPPTISFASPNLYQVGVKLEILP